MRDGKETEESFLPSASHIDLNLKRVSAGPAPWPEASAKTASEQQIHQAIIFVSPQVRLSRRSTLLLRPIALLFGHPYLSQLFGS